MKLSHSLLSGLALTSLAFPVLSNSPIVQPGAPGELPRELSAEEAIEVADTRYTASDAQFMRDMIPHHLQALEMSRLAPDRTNSPSYSKSPARLRPHRETKSPSWNSGSPAAENRSIEATLTGDHHTMKGMATEAQMAALAAASGVRLIASSCHS